MLVFSLSRELYSDLIAVIDCVFCSCCMLCVCLPIYLLFACWCCWWFICNKLVAFVFVVVFVFVLQARYGCCYRFHVKWYSVASICVTMLVKVQFCSLTSKGNKISEMCCNHGFNVIKFYKLRFLSMLFKRNQILFERIRIFNHSYWLQ